METERLTTWSERSQKWVLPQGYGSFRKIAERLAAYESLFDTPEHMRRWIVLAGKVILTFLDERNDWFMSCGPEDAGVVKEYIDNHLFKIMYGEVAVNGTEI